MGMPFLTYLLPRALAVAQIPTFVEKKGQIIKGRPDRRHWQGY